MVLAHPTLGKEEMEETVRVVRGVMEQAASYAPMRRV